MANLTKDQRILKEHPGKEIYEYRALGMSDKGIAELEAAALAKEAKQGEEKEPAKEKPVVTPIEDNEKATPTVTPQIQEPAKATPTIIRAEPTVSQPAAAYNSGMAIIQDINTGKSVPMNRAIAERYAKNRSHLKVI